MILMFEVTTAKGLATAAECKLPYPLRHLAGRCWPILVSDWQLQYQELSQSNLIVYIGPGALPLFVHQVLSAGQVGGGKGV